MNAKRCIKCLVHGDESDHASPHCSRAECNCRKCELISLRREIVHKLKTLSKRNTINFGAEEVFHTRYTCSKCRHHGVIAIKKFHVPCPFNVCDCHWCEFNEQKRVIDTELTLIERAERRGDCSHSPSSSPSDATPSSTLSSSSPSESSSPPSQSSSSMASPTSSYEPWLSPEAKVIYNLLSILSVDPSSFNPDSFDYAALSAFFIAPLILVPDEWMPEIETIFELVHEALKRFPILNGHEFQLGTPYSYSYAPKELYSPYLTKPGR